MDGRLALSRRQQNGRSQTRPCPSPNACSAVCRDRVRPGRWPGRRSRSRPACCPAPTWPRSGTRPLPVRLLIGLVFAYAVVLAFWAIGRFTREGNLVERSVDQPAARPEQAARPVFGGMASTQGPLALTLVFVAVTTAHGGAGRPGPPGVAGLGWSTRHHSKGWWPSRVGDGAASRGSRPGRLHLT